MPKMTVIYDADGTLINIGPWDYKLATAPVFHPITGQPIYDPTEEVVDAAGEVIVPAGFAPRTQQVFGNPLPEGAYEVEAEVSQREDGGLYVV